MEKNSIISNLEKIVGKDHITAEDFALWAVQGNVIHTVYSKYTNYRRPEFIVRPQSPEQVANIMRFLNRYNIPVRIAGGKTSGSVLPLYGEVMLDMMDMDEVIGIDEESMTVTVQAGCPWAKLHTFLEKKGYRTGVLGPHSVPTPSIGGGVSWGSMPVGAAKYGMVVDEVMTLQVVLPNGDIMRTGSRTNPNASWNFRGVNGPDLTGLFCNQSGYFGVITEISLRIYPLPKYTSFISMGYTDHNEGLDALQKVLQTGYSSEILYNSVHLNRMVAAINPQFESIANFQGIINLTLETQNQKILEGMEEEINHILEKFEGVPLPKEIAMVFAYDYQGSLIPLILSLGSIGHVVAVGSINSIKKNWEGLEKCATDYGDYCLKMPGSDTPMLDVSALFGVRQGLAGVSYFWVYSPDNEAAEAKIREAETKTLKFMGEIGLANIQFRGTLSPMERPTNELLRKIKRAVDPDEILGIEALKL